MIFIKKPQYFTIESSIFFSIYNFSGIKGLVYQKKEKVMQVLLGGSYSHIDEVEEETFNNILDLYKQFLQ